MIGCLQMHPIITSGFLGLETSMKVDSSPHAL